MVRFLFRRFLFLVPVGLGITFAAFVLLYLAPGDPVFIILGDEYGNVELREQVRAELGLDAPLLVQYARWLGRVVTGDLGRSLVTDRPVADLVLGRLPTTVWLALVALALAVAVGIGFGVLSAAYRDTWVDNSVRVAATLGIAVPVFWIGMMLILVFSLHLNILPAGGGISRHGWRALVLPASALSASFAALLVRVVRSELVEALQQDFIRTARAKGVAPLRVHLSHALKNALIPIITVVGTQFGLLLSGAVLTEYVFSLPGLGTLLIDSIYRRDFPLIQGALLLIGTSFVFINLLVDIAYSFIDPRVRFS